MLGTLEDEVPSQVGENGKIHATKMPLNALQVAAKETLITPTLELLVEALDGGR